MRRESLRSRATSACPRSRTHFAALRHSGTLSKRDLNLGKPTMPRTMLYLESREQVGQAAEILQGTLHVDLRGAALGAVV